MTMRALTATVLLVVGLVSSCSVDEQGSAQVQDDEKVPFGLLEPNAPALLPPATEPAAEGVSLCFIDDGALVRVVARLDPPLDLRSVTEALAEPPESASASLRTAVGPELVRSVRLARGVARVDFRPAVTEMGGDEQLLAVAQLVCTLTAQPGVGPVSFTLAGTPVDVPRSDGSLTSGPVSRDDYADLLP
ncbi:GerMN domain-containing protein [Aquihabitans daechungensis]|uniref:GerMN domain-containing protein n=1 Tax=Aquihabitans daechungensis TaxID=1052257 RepID=UPI003B9F80F6